VEIPDAPIAPRTGFPPFFPFPLLLSARADRQGRKKREDADAPYLFFRSRLSPFALPFFFFFSPIESFSSGNVRFLFFFSLFPLSESRGGGETRKGRKQLRTGCLLFLQDQAGKFLLPPPQTSARAPFSFSPTRQAEKKEVLDAAAIGPFFPPHPPLSSLSRDEKLAGDRIFFETLAAFPPLPFFFSFYRRDRALRAGDRVSQLVLFFFFFDLSMLRRISCCVASFSKSPSLAFLFFSSPHATLCRGETATALLP